LAKASEAHQLAGQHDKTAALLSGLSVLAERKGRAEEFRLRLQSIRERHAGKRRFLERLTSLG
jgi:hypothetical protein